MSSAAAASPGKPFSFWLMAGICGLLGLIFIILLLMFYTSGEEERSRAMEGGQMVSIRAATGEISGNMIKTEPKESDVIEEGNVSSDLSGFDVGPPEGGVENITTPANPILGKDDFVGSEEEAMETISVQPRTNISLAEAPMKDITKTTAGGYLPKKGGGTSPFEYYRRPFAMPSPAKPVISIVVSGLGANKAQSEEALNLPADVSFAFSPYAKNTPLWMESGRNLGHEAWMMLPAQPKDFPASDPGPIALLADMKPDEELQPRLLQALVRAPGYAGLLLPTGEIISQTPAVMKWLGDQLDKYGLALIVSDPPSGAAGHLAGMVRNADILIDKELDEEAIKSQLAALEQRARSGKAALGVIRPYPLSLKLVDEWLKDLPNKGLVLAPASALYGIK